MAAVEKVETGIYRRGNSYLVPVYAGRDPLTGKQRYRYATAKSLEEARRLRRQLQAEVDKAGHVPPQSMIFGDFLTKKFIPEHVATRRLRTQKGYGDIIANHLVPALGKVRLDRLTREHLVAYFRAKREASKKDGSRALSERTLLHHYRLIHKALNCAVEWGYVGRNVCDQVPPPRPERYRANTLTAEQADKLLEYLKEKGHRHYALIATALGTGARISEILALQWQDVDPIHGVITIRRSLESQGDKTPRFGSTKNGEGRAIAMADFVREALVDRWTEYLREKDAFAQDYRDFGLVFCKENGEPYDQRYITHMFAKALKDAKLPHVRFHDLRHTVATLLLKRNVHPKVVQEILGHSTIQVTLDIYSHVVPGLNKTAAQEL
ncbi:MAG: site-specific integrase, partial [Limnochordaceae bacterium]|nr:site-specific integrase [Limnochordaceae bacterium]